MNSVGFLLTGQGCLLALVAGVIRTRRRDIRRFFHGNGTKRLGLPAFMGACLIISSAAAIPALVIETPPFGALAFASLTIAAVGICAFVAQQRRQVFLLKDTCPICLRVGTLEPSEHDVGPSQTPYLICNGGDDVACKCSIDPARLSTVDACLSFSTLSVPCAGTSFWLMMLHDAIRRDCYPQHLWIRETRTGCSEDFDRGLNDLRDGVLLTRTQMVPEPLMLTIVDNDWWGSTKSLVSVWDCPGGGFDYCRTSVGSSEFRLLQGDGFLFFIDLTRPIDVQESFFLQVVQQLRILRCASPKSRLHVPIAICVPKIDLVVSESMPQVQNRRAIERFRTGLKKIEECSAPWSGSRVRARSELTADFVGNVLPQFPIARLCGEYVSGSIAFFPISSFGMDGSGETDISRRIIDPYGALEPFLWLVEMQGQRVLSG